MGKKEDNNKTLNRFLRIRGNMMSARLRMFQKSKSKIGLPPGSLVFTGEQKTEKVEIKYINYGPDRFEDKTIYDPAELEALKGAPGITWLNVMGIHDAAVVEKIGALYDIHPLTLEDILHVGQRPKAEVFKNYLYITSTIISLDESSGSIGAEQISLLLFGNTVIIFQEGGADEFEPIARRLREAKGQIREQGSDYLVYTILDTIVDYYFLTLGSIGNRIDALEKEMDASPTDETLIRCRHLKRDTIFLRDYIWPLRDVITFMERGDTPFIHETSQIYLRDVYDHIIRVIETIETYREILSEMIDIYLSMISNHLNQVMKVLTSITTIFIPLSFLAGVYGMNFRHMPELRMTWTYPALLIFMAVLGLSMFLYFRKKKWI